MSTDELLKDAIDAVKETVEGDDPETVNVGGVKHVPVKSDDDGPDGEERGEEVGWETEHMTESQTDRDVHHEEVGEVEGDPPDPENETGSDGRPETGTKSVSDAVTEEDEEAAEIDEVEIGHLEINEYYRVWLKDPEEAPPEAAVHPADEAQTEPPTPESTHYYEAPFGTSTAAVPVAQAAEKLAKWEPDPEFPAKIDMKAAEIAQTDTFVADAALTRSVERLTPTTLRMVKSPLTLFFALKRLDGGWDQTRRHIRDEIERRGVEGVDKLRKAEPVPAPDHVDINKRKVYVTDESDVPDQYEVEYGPNGGTFYRPDGEEIDDGDEVESFRNDLQNAVEDPDLDPVDEIPSSLWRDYSGQIEDDDLLFDALEPIQDHGAKFSKDKVRQRLRGMGYSDEEIDDRVADTQEPFTSEQHEEFDASYTEDVVDRTSLYTHDDANTGASADAMEVEELEDGSEVFVTNYGTGAGQQDPEYRSRQMATYQALRALTAEDNVPPHTPVPIDERPEGAPQDADAVAVMEFDGEEAWEAPDSWKENVDRDDYVEQTAKNFICGNNDLHGDNVMLNEDGDIAFHDLDHSAGRLDQNDPINNGNVAFGAMNHIHSTAAVLNLDTDELIDDVLAEAKELAEERGDEVRELADEADDPQLGEMLDNISHNLEVLAEAGDWDELKDGSMGAAGPV